MSYIYAMFDQVESSLQYAQLDKPTYRLCIDKSENPGENKSTNTDIIWKTKNMLCISRLREGAQCRWPDHICKNRNPALWGGEKYFFPPFWLGCVCPPVRSALRKASKAELKWKYKKPSSPHLQHKKLGVCQGSTDVRFKSNQMLEYSTRYFYKKTGKAKRA